MNVLFERFVARLLEVSCLATNIRLDIQRSRSSILVDAATGRSYSSVRPDVVLRWQLDGRSLARPLDTKYKLYDDRKVDAGDLYQCLLYAYAFNDSNDVDQRRSVLVFPSRATAERQCVRVKTLGGGQGPAVSVVGFNLEDAITRVGDGRLPDPRLLELAVIA
jgi:5-methylcytosine-specific restriction enzyme subunit McrC